jgi:Tol biopolymer transport system component
MRLSAVLLLLSSLLAPRAFADESAFISRARQLTFEGRRSGEGYFSPDGTKLVFQSEREPGNPFYQIYVLDLETGETTRVSPGIGKTTCAFIQPGRGDVLFASTHLDPRSEALQAEELTMRAEGRERRYAWDYDENFDLFVAPAGGGEPRRLTDARGYDAEGAFSPDGGQIVFCSTRSAYPPEALSPEDRALAEINPAHFGEIYIMNADGSDVRRLTDHPGYDGGPFFSADGGRIVWRRFDVKGTTADIYTMATDGSDVQRLTDFGSMSWAPYFHPSGDYVIFASNKHGFENFELFLVDAMGEKEPVRVTFTPGFDGLPVFSPDGGRLTWTSTRHAAGEARSGGQIYLADWNDAAAREALDAAPARSAAKAQPASQPTSRPIREAEAESEARLREIVATLASDEMEGRLTGTAGEQAAADYLSREFEAIGLRPLPGGDGFQHPFSFTAGVRPGPDNALEIRRIPANPHLPMAERLDAATEPIAFTPGEEFLPLPISDEGTTSGLVAFAGYGLVVPGPGGELQYDSYGELDVRGRVVVILRYVPEGVSPEQRQVFNRYAGLRYKAMQARERGAAGLIVVSGPNSPGAGALVPMSLDAGGVSSGIVAASASAETVDRMLQGSGRTLAELQTALDAGERTDGLLLEDVHVSMKVDLLKETRTGANVIGHLPGETGEYIVIGAHFDHLGRGGGSSLARAGEEEGIHYGADDNASGVAAMIEIAARMAREEPRQRGLIFAAWSGEELGLLGSSKFCESPPVELSRIGAYLNMDMVGRVRDNQLAIQGLGSSPDWPALVERRNAPAGFSLSLSDDPYLPTDTTPFYLKGVPVLAFFSGAHEDYHRPTDTADKINYVDLTRVARLVGAIAADLADAGAAPAFARVERAQGPMGGDRETLRAYLGTIPDYVTEDIAGVKLAGARAGSPAERAGLREGDVITGFAGQKIANIYDFTYALDAVKIGEPVELIVDRGGETLTLSVTPEARQ